MSGLFKTLTTSCVEGEPIDCRYVLPGYVKQLGLTTTLYLGADTHRGEKADKYSASITVFSRGERVKPMGEGFCFDLSRAIGYIICIRGMHVNRDGKPLRFLLEYYKRQTQRNRMRLVS